MAYSSRFLVVAKALATKNGYELVRFFYLQTCETAIKAILSEGLVERSCLASNWSQK